jgi:hypothetical protein
MIKTVIDKLEDVTEALRGEYKQGADGKFYVELDKLPDNHPVLDGLLKAKKRVAAEKEEVAAQLAATKAALDKAKNDLHDRLKGKVEKSDLEALEESYKTKLADAEAKGKETETKLTASLRDVLVDSEARRLASKLAVDPDAADLLSESIQRRLTVEISTDGKAATRVLDATGKPSAASLEDFEKEIVATKKYSGLLLGSRASGSSASGSQGAGSAQSGKVDWLRGNPADLAKAAAKVNPLLGG